MRLKQCIFALVAMLLCAFSANAQGGSVAKIGNTEYTTFADAMAAANAATGNVDVEVYGAVEFIDGMELNGSYSTITFTGKSAEAKITINQTAGGDYLTAHGKTVAFNDLILAKANPAWSGNSGHMGNYFSIQGGTVTYTDCTFPNGACTSGGTATYDNCTFQNTSEYGLWVYDDALVTVNGGTIDSKKGIKVYSEDEQSVTSTLTVKNATFTANVSAKPAVAVGYAQSITLIGNTYNNTTAHVELDSGSDADCEGITFVAQDSEGNDIASTLKMTDRSNSSAPCGVLVGGKIYTTVTEAAAEATEGSTVTLLYDSTEEVELPEGVTLDKNGYTADNVTVATSGVAQVGENVFTTVLEALQYAIDNNAAELKILCDVREKMTIDFDLNINADLTITADAPVKVEFYNDGTSYDFAVGSTNNNTLTIGVNVHFDLVDRVIWLGYWGNNVTVVVNGYLGGYQIWHGANTVVKGTLDSHGEAFIMRRDATLTANEGAKVNANYFQIYSGHIVAENATITAGLVWVNNNHNYGNEGTVSFELDNTEFTSNGEVKIYAGEGKIVSVTLENSSSFDAKGVVTLGDNVKVVADATSSIQDANGPVVIPVAKIGDVEYATLAEAVAAAQAGDEIVLLSDVAEDATLPAGVKFNGNDKAVGNLTAGGEITFTGVTKATSFGVQYTNTTVNIVPGASLVITGADRMVIGHGCTFNITGSIEDAKTADVAALTPSLIIPGASFTGAGVTFNVTNAYIKTTASYCSSSKTASGTFDFNIENSIWEQFGKLAFEAQSVDATVNFDLVESVLNTTSHLVFGVSRGEVVIDNSNVNVGTSRQIENQSTMTIKNGSVVNGAVATSSNAKNPGTIIVENATYAVTGEFSGSDLGTGTLIVKKGATVSAGSITKANIQIDATGMAAGDVINLTANLSNLAGTIEVINNDNLDASIVDGKIVLAVKPVAKIGDVEYTSLEDAFEAAAATAEATITLIEDLTIESDLNNAGKGYFNVADGKKVTLDLGGKTITATDNSTGNFILFYSYGEFTIKNGTVVLTATNDRDWNAQSTIVLNRGGIFNCESGTYTHNGGTDMAFVFDNSGNYYGDATTNIKGGELTSTYIAIRNRMEQNSHGASGKAILNVTGGKINGTSRAIWAQAASKSETAPATGAINVSGGEVGLIDTPRSTGAVSMTTISGGTVAAFKGEAGELTVKGGTIGNVEILTAAGEATDYAITADGVYAQAVAKIGETKYTDLQEAIKAAAPAGTVELLSDVTVDEWIMFSETLTIGNGDIITTQINGLTINGNGKTVTIKDIESAGNGARLFYDATNLNINNLTFNFVDNAANLGGIGLTAGTIKNVTFNGGGYAIFPGTGAVTIEGCTFKTNATSIYYEEERDNLVVTGNTFENPDNVNVILLRGNTTFTDNNVISGRTVNVVSGSPVVTGNNFNDVRFKVYNVATATIEENTINTLAFNDESVVNSTFDNNTLSEEAQAVLDAAEFPVAGLLGEGTAENPYLIETLNDLKFFRDDVNTYTQDGSNQYKGKYVKLTADIDLAGENWEPIGKNSNGDHQNFLGTFYGEKADGTKPTISNLYINADGDHLGFFARVGSYDEGLTPTVKNIKFNNVDVSSNTTNSHGGSYVAGVIANAGGNSVVSGIEVTGDVYVVGYGYIGGIVGHGYPDIDNCHVAANDGSYINSHYWCVGGIIGYAGEGGTPITNSSVSGVDIWSAYGAAAAIAGLLQDGNKLENVSASNVDITSNSDYCMGYIAGNGNASTMTGISIENVTATAKGNPINPTDAVAKVNDAVYFSLSAALNAAQTGETVTLLADVETADGIVITDKNLVIDLNGKTYTTTEGASTNNRNFKIEGTSVVTIKNGTMVAAGDYSSGAYGTVRTEGSANVTLEGLKLYNYRGNGLNIKACGSSVVTINDTEIYSNYGGGIESAGGTIEIANVKVEQKGMYTAPYNSMAISVNSGGKVTVNSGTFSTECITAEEANNQGTSHGPWVAGVLNSGGTLIINGGTFSNDNFGENSLATYARGAILADTKAKVEINGGTFNVLKNVIDIQNNLGDANNNPSVVLAGGTYNADPRISAQYGSNLITLADGYTVVENTDGTYGVEEAPAYVAKIGEQGYETLAAALEAANDGETVTLVWAEGDAPIAMNGSVFGKSVTITGTATVDWSNGWFFVGRGGEGDATVTFDGANLTSASANENSGLGIHVSGREKGTSNKYDGTLVIKNSTIELDYLINRGAIELGEGAILTVKNGFGIAGRPASETESGVAATATVTLNSGSKLVVNNHNGMGVGQAATDPEGYGVMNVNAGAAFETTQAFLVTSNGTMNVAAGGAVSVNGTLTVNGTLVSAGNIAATIAAGTGATIEISGGVYTQDVNEWCVENYAALPDLSGNYVVGVKPTATVNNLGMTTVAAGDYSIWNGSFDSNTEDDGDMPLSFVMQFLADQDAEDMDESPYADWYGDFVITFTGLENGSFTADGCYLAGHYGSFGWVKVPVDGMTIEEGARYPVMLGVGLGQKYDYICSSVEDFKCALYLTPEILEANPNIQVKLELGVVDNSKGSDAAASALINNENVYSVTEYTYDAEDFVVDPNYIAELTIDDAEGENYTNDTEKTVGTLTYKRTLINGKWNALYLPFKVELTDELLANYDFADYNQMISSDTNGDRVPDSFEMELFIYTSGTLYANYPYFVRPKNEEACSLNLVLTDATLYPANEISLVTSSVKNTFKLSGTYSAMDEAALAGKYAISIDGDWSYTVALKPYRLYLTITDNNGAFVTSGASKSVRIVVRGEDGTTEIEGVYENPTEDMIFDLQGRRVLEPQKGGMYIINGKKVIF